jgi:hypothetical protein
MLLDRDDSMTAASFERVGNDFFDLREFGEDDLSCAHELVAPLPCGLSVKPRSRCSSFARNRDL